ncbi:uncharacterized protein LOC111698980 isoform X3 [Eurytemora carolleeae]|uniref:uncharacterized protein LOC111698980 isoform X3 n=1 Tax=Eurytemora carolleeae TaxID=1294199 RepID=UPI000C78C946|nr:uncharacterized protein LOC111698980 isoform X3 [Eurytemora carolleeae]|eukprot:XP_023325276.1 uncharacterized protein LOC111698980 isoform X3 [Eurytemora affinis]
MEKIQERKRKVPLKLDAESLVELGKEIWKIVRMFQEGLISKALASLIESHIESVSITPGQISSIVTRLKDMFITTKLMSGDILIQCVKDPNKAHLDRFEKKIDRRTRRVLELDINRAQYQELVLDTIVKRLPDVLVAKIQELLMENEDGLDFFTLREMYHRRFEYQLNPRDYGYETFRALVTDLVFAQQQEEIELTFGEDNRCYLRPAGKLRKDYLKKDCKGFSKVSLLRLVIDRPTQNRIEQVLLNNTDIHFRTLGSVYSELYKKPLDPKKFYCFSMDELVLFNSHFLKVKNGIVTLQKPSSNAVLKSATVGKPSLPAPTIPISSELQKDVVGFHEIEEMEISHLKENTWVNMKITHVINPDLLYGCLKDLETTMKGFESNMNEFYFDGRNSDRLRLSIDEVGVGLSVALLYTDGYWYRGRVTQVLGGDKCTVFYIDYGYTCQVILPAMRHLHLKFSDMKAQAIRFGLFTENQAPSNNWSISCKQKLKELIQQCESSYNIPVADGDEPIQGALALILPVPQYQMLKGCRMSVQLKYIRDGNLLVEINPEIKTFRLAAPTTANLGAAPATGKPSTSAAVINGATTAVNSVVARNEAASAAVNPVVVLQVAKTKLALLCKHLKLNLYRNDKKFLSNIKAHIGGIEKEVELCEKIFSDVISGSKIEVDSLNRLQMEQVAVELERMMESLHFY